MHAAFLRAQSLLLAAGGASGRRATPVDTYHACGLGRRAGADGPTNWEHAATAKPGTADDARALLHCQQCLVNGVPRRMHGRHGRSATQKSRSLLSLRLAGC